MISKPLNRWVYIMIGTFALIFAGLIYAWATFAPPIAKHFPEWTSAQMSLTATIVMCGFCFGGLLGGIMQKKMKPFVILLISAFLLILGFILTSRTNSLALLYIGFGVLAGLGSGISYNVFMSCVSRWFPDKKGLCSGILLMGFGIGSFLLGKVYAAVTPETGGEEWRTVFLIFGIVIFAVIVFASVFTIDPPAGWNAPAPKKPQKEVAFYQELTPFEMLKSRNFWLFMIWTLFMSAAGLMIIFQGNNIARTTLGFPTLGEITETQAGTVATIVGLISVFNGVGRVIMGLLFDKLGRKWEMFIGGILYMIGLLLTIFALSGHSGMMLVIAYIFTGLAYGSVPPTNSSFALQFFGPRNYAVNLPIINLNLFFASFSSTLSGAIYDSKVSVLKTQILAETDPARIEALETEIRNASIQAYDLIIYIIIALVVIGIIVNFLIRKPKDAR